MSSPQFPNSDSALEDTSGRSKNRPDRVRGKVGYLHDYSEDPPPGPSSHRYYPKKNTRYFSGFLLLIFFVFVLSGVFYAGMIVGRDVATPTAKITAPSEPQTAKPLAPEALTQLNVAMTVLRNGDPSKAMKALQNLIALYPNTPALLYATAIAALTVENLELAETMAESCVATGYRKSDALALLANIELAKASLSELPSFADPTLRAKDYLTQAIEADPLNPGPHIEMAAIARRLGDTDGALAHLERGKNLVFPVDTIVVTQTTLAILKDESATTNPDDPVPPFVLAVRNAREGDTHAAALLFSDCRRHLPEETYAFLISDPAVRKFIDQPELKDVLAGR